MSPALSEYTVLAREAEIRARRGKSGEDLLPLLEAAWARLSASERASVAGVRSRASSAA